MSTKQYLVHHAIIVQTQYLVQHAIIVQTQYLVHIQRLAVARTKTGGQYALLLLLLLLLFSAKARLGVWSCLQGVTLPFHYQIITVWKDSSGNIAF